MRKTTFLLFLITLTTAKLIEKHYHYHFSSKHASPKHMLSTSVISECKERCNVFYQNPECGNICTHSFIHAQLIIRAKKKELTNKAQECKDACSSLASEHQAYCKHLCAEETSTWPMWTRRRLSVTSQSRKASRTTQTSAITSTRQMWPVRALKSNL